MIGTEGLVNESTGTELVKESTGTEGINGGEETCRAE